MSTQMRPPTATAKCDSAASSFSPARETNLRRGASTRRSQSLATACPALSAATPLTRTRPANSSALACASVSASPRATSKASSRSLGTRGARGIGFLAGLERGKRLVELRFLGLERGAETREFPPHAVPFRGGQGERHRLPAHPEDRPRVARNPGRAQREDRRASHP